VLKAPAQRIRAFCRFVAIQTSESGPADFATGVERARSPRRGACLGGDRGDDEHDAVGGERAAVAKSTSVRAAAS
jgi:hypothetical protein